MAQNETKDSDMVFPREVLIGKGYLSKMPGSLRGSRLAEISWWFAAGTQPILLVTHLQRCFRKRDTGVM